MEKAEVNMMTDYGIFVPIKEDSMFESYIGQQISIFNMNSTVLFAEGLAYPLSVFTNCLLYTSCFYNQFKDLFREMFF